MLYFTVSVVYYHSKRKMGQLSTGRYPVMAMPHKLLKDSSPCKLSSYLLNINRGSSLNPIRYYKLITS